MRMRVFYFLFWVTTWKKLTSECDEPHLSFWWPSLNPRDVPTNVGIIPRRVKIFPLVNYLSVSMSEYFTFSVKTTSVCMWFCQCVLFPSPVDWQRWIMKWWIVETSSGPLHTSEWRWFQMSERFILRKYIFSVSDEDAFYKQLGWP